MNKEQFTKDARGGCNLSSEDVIKVQDQLLEYIKNKLNE